MIFLLQSSNLVPCAMQLCTFIIQCLTLFMSCWLSQMISDSVLKAVLCVTLSVFSMYNCCFWKGNTFCFFAITFQVNHRVRMGSKFSHLLWQSLWAMWHQVQQWVQTSWDLFRVLQTWRDSPARGFVVLPALVQTAGMEREGMNALERRSNMHRCSRRNCG